MSNDIRQVLHQRIAAERSRLCEDGLNDGSEDFESRAQRLKVYQDLLNQIPAPWIRRLALPLVVAGLSVTLAGLLLTRKSPTQVLLAVEASGVQIAPKQAFGFFQPADVDIRGTRFWITGVNKARVSPGLNLPVSGNAVESLRLCDGRFLIDKLGINLDEAMPTNSSDADTRFVDIQVFEKDAPTLYLRGSSAQVDLRLWGPVRLTQGPCGLSGKFAGPQILSQLAETLYVETAVSRTRPVQLSFQLDQGRQLMFRQIQVDSLRFVREVAAAPGQREFVSTIHAANLSLLDSGASESVSSGTFLELEGFVGSIRQIKIGERLEVQAEGSAVRVLSGPPGYQRDLTPSYLQFLKSNKQLGLLWAGVVFLWGLLWSGKRLLAH